MTNTQLLTHFIEHRHIAYLWRKHGGPAPSDPILREYRFCNLSRNLDAGTIEMHRWYNGLDEVTAFTAIVARTINLVPALKHYAAAFTWSLGYCAPAMLELMRSRMGMRLPVRGNAYMMTTHGSDMSWPEFYANTVFQDAWVNRCLLETPTDTLMDYAKSLQRVVGVGPFLAGQVIADLKVRETHVWMQNVHDVDSFAVPGPGSRRGVKLLDRPGSWHNTVLWVRDLTNELLRSKDADYRVDAQDAQNVLCEFDKYMRVRNGGSYRRRL